jgi:PAS domain S-box-containing protein
MNENSDISNVNHNEKIKYEKNESKENYQCIIENLNDLVIVLNKDGRYEYINEISAYKLLGYNREDLIGQSMLNFVHPDDVERVTNSLQEVYNNKEEIIESRYKHKDGNWIWFETKLKTFKDKTGNLKLLGVSREITKQKLTYKKLKKNEERYRRIAENIDDLILILNTKIEFEYVNEKIALKLIGYRNNDLIGKSVLNYIHPDDVEQVIDFFGDRNKFKNIIIELRFKHKKKHWIWFDCRGKAYYDKSGLLKWFIILKNITERITAEERYQFIFEKSPNAILLINFKGILIDSNITSEKLFGYDKDFFIDRPFDEFPDIFPIEIKSFFKKIFKASFKGEFPEPIEVEIKKKEGKNIWVNIQASLLKIENETLIQFIFQDITQKKKAELLEEEFKDQLESEVNSRTKELNDALEQQKHYLDQIIKSSKFKTEFMASMSHELRTPLNAIIGFTDLLLEGIYGPLNSEQLDFLKDIKSSAEHQFDMIKHILDISKIEAGQLTLNIQKFSLNSIVNQIKSSLKPLYRKKVLKFKIKGLETEKEIYADPIRFKEILLNLVSNAVKYTIEGKITLLVQEKYDYWLFKVRDTGIGIATKDYNLIFKEFKRVDSPYVRSVTGTGLGLSLTRRLINLHGGEISFRFLKN